MKITFQQFDLLPALLAASGVIDRRAHIPILSNVLIRAKADQAVISSTDLDTQIDVTLPCSVAHPGSISLTGETLKLLTETVSGEIAFEGGKDGEQIIIRAAGASWHLDTLAASDFPDFIDKRWEDEFTLPALQLRNLIKPVTYAISTEETRYYLNGVFLQTSDKDDARKLLAVATDGHRLARAGLAVGGDFPAIKGVIIPRRAVRVLLEMLDRMVAADPDSLVTVSLAELKIRFAGSEQTIRSKLIDGTYPPFERVVPTENKNLLETGTDALLGAIRRLRVLGGNPLTLQFGLGIRDSMLSAQREGQTADQTIQGHFTGNPLNIGFSAGYLEQVLAQHAGQFMTAEIGDPSTPVIFRFSGAPETFHVLMPMRV